MTDFLEIVLCKYKDPKMALWMKAVCIVVMVFHLCAGIFYPVKNKMMVLMVFTLMIVILSINCYLSTKKAYRYLDTITFIILFTPNLHLFRGSNIGYFSMFYLLLFSLATIFILGIKTSILFQFAGIIYLAWELKGTSLSAYDTNLILRYPYLYLCMVGIAYIIMFSIQRYWVEKQKSHLILQERINEEKKQLAHISLDIITSMYSALSAKIPGIDQHCMRVGNYCKELAILLELDETTCMNAYYAGLLHEVGAVGLPDEVINQERLSDDEYEIYKTYVKRGYKIICELQISDEVAKAVLYHRENYDGSGYLEGLFGMNIPVLSRILAICDYVDRHLSWHESSQEICDRLNQKKGKQFDPQCVEKMCELLNKGNERCIYGS